MKVVTFRPARASVVGTGSRGTPGYMSEASPLLTGLLLRPGEIVAFAGLPAHLVASVYGRVENGDPSVAAQKTDAAVVAALRELRDLISAVLASVEPAVPGPAEIAAGPVTTEEAAAVLTEPAPLPPGPPNV